VAVVAVVAVLGAWPAAGDTQPAAPLPRGSAPIVPRILAPMALDTADGVALGPDGSTYVTEADRDRILAERPDGSIDVVSDTVEVPTAIASSDEGRLAIVTEGALVLLAADGTRTDRALPPNSTLGAVAFDSTGQVLATDVEQQRVVRLDDDGRWTEVDFSTSRPIRGLAIGDDDSIYVIDRDLDDVVRRETNGTETVIDFTDLAGAIALDVEGDRIAVVKPSAVVVREGDGTEGSPSGLTPGDPRDVDLGGAGTLLVAFHPVADDRSGPSGPGGLLRLVEGGTVERIDFGDLASFISVAAAGPTTVRYTSWSGAQGYSETNPIRQVVGDGPPTDVDDTGGSFAIIDAANDSTTYRSDGRTLTRLAPEGTASDVPLPTEAGIDAVVDLSVDETGRLFVVLGSGYGTGRFKIVEPLAAGGMRTWLESDGTEDQFLAMAAGGGTVQIVTVGLQSGPQRLLEVKPDGTLRQIRELDPPQVRSLEVDAAGTAYLVTVSQDRGDITVAQTTGDISSLTYEGITSPRDLSMGLDGTLYVGDDGLGLIALDGVGPVGIPAAPGTAAPATPVPGAPNFTG